MRHLAIAALTAALIGCGSTNTHIETTPLQRPTSPVSSLEDSVELQTLALTLAWGQASPSDQELMCGAVRTVPELAVDAFMEGGGDTFDRSVVRLFLVEQCR